MADQQEQVMETLTEPELIQQGDYGALLAIRFYDQTPLTSKYLVVVYHELNRNDGFIFDSLYHGPTFEQ